MIGLKFYKDNYDLTEYSTCANWCNNNNATIEDKGAYYEVVKIAPYVPTKEEQVQALKAQLASTDYVAIKIAEGVATKEEYADVLAKRAELRKQINDLEN